MHKHCQAPSISKFRSQIELLLKLVRGSEGWLPRWVAERTIAWLGNYRRLSKDSDVLKSTAENMIRSIAILRIMVSKCV